MPHAYVLGCGLVGATMAKSLASIDGVEVTVADLNESALASLQKTPGVSTRTADLSDTKAVGALAREADIVLGALPSRFGLAALEAVIRTGTSYCDITFMPEDATSLDGLAKEFGTTAIVDCGVSPGLSNMMVGHAVSQLDEAQRAVIYVGGLPKERLWPFEYKAPFAPSDVVEEYTRPARLVENGKIVAKVALSEPEIIELPRAGSLEAFNTDGLRSLLHTVKIPDMREKTLRYPGHIELMRVFRATGLFSKEPIEVGGVTVRPLDVTSKLLFPLWKLGPDDREFTVLHVAVEGIKGNARKRYTYDLFDEYDEPSKNSSMARTTAFPNIIAAQLIMAGKYTDAGVFPPELLAMRDGVFDHFVGELGKLGVVIETRIDDLA